MFGFLKSKFLALCNSFATKVASIFSSGQITGLELEKFFELLVSFDMGIEISRDLITSLQSQVEKKSVSTHEEILRFVKEYLNKILVPLPSFDHSADVVLLLGINGAGKTTTAAKIAARFVSKGEKVLLVAADTFRAAAVEQLKQWADVVGVGIFVGKENADPASVVFDSQKFATENGYTKVIIDTAGRLHTSANLLSELKKVCAVADKVFVSKKIARLIVVDAILGQNSFEQVKTFSSVVNLSGVILTKLDSSAKGGVVFAIAKKFNLPVVYITVSENDLSGIQEFNATEYVEQLFNKA